MADRDKIRDAIAEAIGSDIYWCSRVWEAWSAGTMAPDDFVPVAESDEFLDDLTDAVMKVLGDEV